VPQGMQALAVLLVLLPGFFSAKIVQTLCVRSKQSELDKVVEALLFSLFTYILFALTLGVELPLLILYSLILGFAWGWVINHDALLKWLRRLGFTQRSRRVSAWSDIFHILGGTVQIGLKDGRMAEGWLRCYSDEAEDAALFLESASWIDENGKIYPVDGPGILFTKESEIQFVIFLRDNPPDGRAKGPVGGQAPTV
jgi:Family of unknown function (DUF6338)